MWRHLNMREILHLCMTEMPDSCGDNHTIPTFLHASMHSKACFQCFLYYWKNWTSFMWITLMSFPTPLCKPHKVDFFYSPPSLFPLKADVHRCEQVKMSFKEEELIIMHTLFLCWLPNINVKLTWKDCFERLDIIVPRVQARNPWILLKHSNILERSWNSFNQGIMQSLQL